ncbi:hypothetical protein FACS1894176_03690 [Bacteroidia bacterium]|nr:hypothetical protein FACS1894176_03690 [Bacteroidia bacterium]
MILLCVIAFIRIFYLWIFIILSPIIILFYCLSSIGKEKIKEIEGIAKALKDKGFDISGFIHLAFKPVLVSLGLSLALIFLVLMNGLIKKHQEILEQS